jgi:iron complex transport system permease protein
MKLLGFLFVLSTAILWLAPHFGLESLSTMDAETAARILDLRWPRSVLAWMAGGSLAVCGAVMQTLLRNGLATPFTLGVSSAASLGAFLVLAFPALELAGSSRPMALLFALVELALVIAIARRSRRADGLILAGVTFNFLFAALMMLVRYLADPYRLASMDRWLMGSLDIVGWETPLSLIPWLLVGLAMIAWKVRALDFLAFDAELAEARGINAQSSERFLLLATGLLTAAVVSHTGPIGFVGLLVPHAIRPFTGMRHDLLLPASFLAGGGFLVLADSLARSVELLGRHSEMPVGIITALVGAPLFLWLLRR